MNLLQKIIQNKLFKISSLHGVSVLVRVITGVFSSQAMAHFIGPNGLALMGNFRNFISSIESIGVLGLQNGLIQSIASNNEDSLKIKQTLTSVFYCVLLLGLGLGTIIFFNAAFLSNYLFETIKYSFPLKMIAVLLPFQLFNVLITTVLNGFTKYKKVVYITIITYVLGLLLSIYFMWKLNILGAMISVSILTLVILIISLFYLNSVVSVKEIFQTRYFNKKAIFMILPLGFMTLFSAFLVPIVYIFIRKNIILFDSIEAAGFYEAMNRISGFYFMFIAALMSFYFLPELSKATSKLETNAIFKNYFIGIIPFFAFALVLLFFIKKWIVLFLFTKEFQPVSNLFLGQMIGDFFKALSLILGMQFYAKKMVKSYFVTEIISIIILAFSSYFAIKYYGVLGSVWAYAFTYSVYFLILIIYFRKTVFVK